MVKYSELKEVFKDIDIPCDEYIIFTDEIQNVPTPSMVYRVIGTQPQYADNIVVVEFFNVRLELLTDSVDIEIMSQIEQCLNSNELSFNKDIEFSVDLNLYSTTYDFTVLGK